MAVAAYASLLSLTRMLESIQSPARLHQLRLDTKQIQCLQAKVKLLLDFLEVYGQRRSQEMEDLATQIADAAEEAEDAVDRHVVDQLRDGSQDESHREAAFSSFCQDIDKVIAKIESIIKELMMAKEEWADPQEQKPIASLPVGSSDVLSSIDKNSTVVGFDEHLVRVMDELTRDELDLQIFPIVGMGGIGKTTLARNIFEHPYIVNHFDMCKWLTISQENNVRKIVLDLLNDVKTEDDNKKTLAELGNLLHKKLFGRRYLIVMDDVWNTNVWDDLKLFLPKNKTGSRILVTTRLSNVVVSLSSNKSYMMDFLDEDKSWNLLCQETFSQESCPYPELENIGKDIAKGCKGLPLAIVVIGGLLGKSNMTRESWELVAKNLTSVANSEDDDYCLRILSLSYHNLPIHLKPCFLYMGVFREDYKITVSKLAKLWVAEGFLKPIRGKSLEQVAEAYLRDLIDRNLILVRTYGHGRNIETCGIHDLLRDVCLRENEKENFMRSPKVQRAYIGSGYDMCFACGRNPTSHKIDLNEVHVASQQTSLVSVSVCNTCRNMYPRLTRVRLVRVRVIVRTRGFSRESYEEILHPTNVRYLKVKSSADWEFAFPSTMALLWNLQVLTFGLKSGLPKAVLPPEIFDMPQLRHLIAPRKSVFLPDQTGSQGSVSMANLQTLFHITNFRCTEEIVQRMPNLKELKVSYYGGTGSMEWSYYCLYNLARLSKLESLFVGSNGLLSLENLRFPTSLKELRLYGCSIPWEKLKIVGSLLPNLKVLSLSKNTYKGREWNQVEGEFPRLKVLTIFDCQLVWWRAENVNFPNLESLVLSFMWKLEEMPSVIGDIPTLRSIHLESCNNSVVDSAMQILEEQQSYGNESLQLYVDEKQVCVS
ncbi:putative late blight resistance protein homolog R1A-10 [Sesamum indicum]|uniref:Late blight resistance protein homolog R1A-10 n=1 Tax=Sesamum indicum TaxID=4182 RepID=A0A6I9SX27_SESIN|nr:putative late blight resistance protein homolog R1A-10 [Sesamum indicum]